MAYFNVSVTYRGLQKSRIDLVSVSGFNVSFPFLLYTARTIELYIFERACAEWTFVACGTCTHIVHSI